jgi:hypothetical protein
MQQEPIMRRRSEKKGSSIFSTDVDAHEVMDDLLGLGIKLDKNQVERMQQSLNTRTRLETARHMANERRSALDGCFTASVDKSKRDAQTDLAMSRSYAATYSAHKGFMPLNSKRVAELVRDIDNRTGRLKADSRSIMNKTIDALQVQYKRNADDFVNKLLNVPAAISKRGMAASKQFTKTLLNDDTKRFLDLTSFINGVLNVIPTLAQNNIVMLFSLLSERMRQLDADGRVWTMVVCVDVVGFLCLLDHASLDKRRSFAHKTSKASNDVEFWSDKRHSFTNKPTLNPAEAKAIPQASNRGMSVRPRGEFGAVGGNSDLSSFNCMLKSSAQIENDRIAGRDSIPALLTQAVRKGPAPNQAFGHLKKEYTTRAEYNVEDALMSPRKSAASPSKNSHTHLENEQYQKKGLLDQTHDIKRMAHNGVGIASAMGRPETCKGEPPKNSFASLKREEYNKDSVASALGSAREDFIGRSVRWEERVAAKNTAAVVAGGGRGGGNQYELVAPKDLPGAPTTPGAANVPPPGTPAAAAAAAAPVINVEGRNMIKDSSPIRQKSYGTLDKDVVSDRAQYSASTALASPRFSNKVPETNSRFFIEKEQFQHKSTVLLDSARAIAHQSNHGVGVFQCMNYQSN